MQNKKSGLLIFSSPLFYAEKKYWELRLKCDRKTRLKTSLGNFRIDNRSQIDILAHKTLHIETEKRNLAAEFTRIVRFKFNRLRERISIFRFQLQSDDPALPTCLSNQLFK